MPRFIYTARTRDGQNVSDGLDAPTRKDAARLLATRGLQPVRLREAGGSSAVARSTPPILDSVSRTLTAELQLPFLQSLSELVGSGLPAGEAVRLLSQRLQEPRQRALCGRLWEKLSEGLPLSLALQTLPAVFPAHTVNLIAAGEATGNLREVIERLIQHYVARQELSRLVTAALAYPVFICAVALGVILFFVFFLLPRLQTLLNSLGGQLPWSTRLLVGLSDFILHYGLVALVAGALGLVMLWRWRRTAAGRLRSDGLLLRLPFAGHFATGTAIHTFSSTLAVLLENGITTAEALRMTERTLDNRALQTAFRDATGRVLEGESLSQSLARTGLFPPLVTDRLAVGESTGQLAPSLRGIARSYQQELERSLRAFTQILSTGVLLFAFAFVAFIAYAIVSAVFQVSASFKF
jgi:type II secretory pathway component PulF